MAEDMVLPMLKEFREEFRDFRRETNANFTQVFHRLNLVEVRLTSVEKQVAALLLVVPVLSERMDSIEARVAALEAAR